MVKLSKPSESATVTILYPAGVLPVSLLQSTSRSITLEDVKQDGAGTLQREAVRPITAIGESERKSWPGAFLLLHDEPYQQELTQNLAPRFAPADGMRARLMPRASKNKSPAGPSDRIQLKNPVFSSSLYALMRRASLPTAEIPTND
jgi:hypothetical protein